MTNASVEEILTEKFKTLPGLNTYKTRNKTSGVITIRYRDVSFPNEAFTRPDDGYWYEVNFGTVNSLPVELGPEERLQWTGTMIVNICVPKNTGMQAVNSRYETISKLFRVGKIDKGVRILSCEADPPFDDGDYTVKQVFISWQSYLER